MHDSPVRPLPVGHGAGQTVLTGRGNLPLCDSTGYFSSNWCSNPATSPPPSETDRAQSNAVRHTQSYRFDGFNSLLSCQPRLSLCLSSHLQNTKFAAPSFHSWYTGTPCMQPQPILKKNISPWTHHLSGEIQDFPSALPLLRTRGTMLTLSSGRQINTALLATEAQWSDQHQNNQQHNPSIWARSLRLLSEGRTALVQSWCGPQLGREEVRQHSKVSVSTATVKQSGQLHTLSWSCLWEVAESTASGRNHSFSSTFPHATPQSKKIISLLWHLLCLSYRNSYSRLCTVRPTYTQMVQLTTGCSSFATLSSYSASLCCSG